MKTAFFVFVMAASVGLADEGPVSRPYLVIVDTYRHSVDQQRIHHDLVQQWIPEKHRTEFSLKQFIVNDLDEFNPVGFLPVNGKANCVDERGYLVQFPFRAAADHDAFRKYIDAVIKRAGADAVAEDDGNRVRLGARSAPLPVFKGASPGVKITGKANYSGAYIAYDDGVIVSGPSEAVLRAPFSDLKSFVNRAQGKSWALYFDPSAIPGNQRESNLGKFSQGVDTRTQQRDDEVVQVYDARRAMSDAYTELIRSLWQDIETCSGSVSAETETEPLVAEFELTAKKNTPLEKHLQQLAKRPSISLPDSPDDVIALDLAVRIPDQFKDALMAVLQEKFADDSPLRQAIAAQIQDGAICGGLRLTDNGDGDLQLASAFQTAIETVPSDEWKRVFAAVETAGEWATVRHTIPCGKSMLPVNLSINIQDHCARLDIVRAELPHSEPEVKLQPQSSSQLTLLAVKGDLAACCVGSEQNSDFGVFAKLEELVDELLRRSQGTQGYKNSVDVMLSRQFGFQKKPAEFVSLQDKLAEDGDWSFELKVETDGARLIANARVGANLMRLARCRQQLLLSNL
ncbi:MAG: hypothetical protein WAO83_02660 [Fuerstiella sp.]